MDGRHASRWQSNSYQSAHPGKPTRLIRDLHRQIPSMTFEGSVTRAAIHVGNNCAHDSGLPRPQEQFWRGLAMTFLPPSATRSNSEIL